MQLSIFETLWTPCEWS